MRQRHGRFAGRELSAELPSEALELPAIVEIVGFQQVSVGGDERCPCRRPAGGLLPAEPSALAGARSCALMKRAISRPW